MEVRLEEREEGELVDGSITADDSGRGEVIEVLQERRPPGVDRPREIAGEDGAEAGPDRGETVPAGEPKPERRRGSKRETREGGDREVVSVEGRAAHPLGETGREQIAPVVIVDRP